MPAAKFRISFSRYLLITVLQLAVIAVTFIIYVRAEKRIDRANDMRHVSFLLAAELRQSSDDLTRMARTYVITGEPKYKKQYQAVLDIRDGKIPRPVGYESIYWDEVSHHETPVHTGSTGSIPLLERMRRNGFSEKELAKLTQAKVKSDQLAVMEFEAMKLAEATGPDAESSHLKARIMMYDQRYHEAKAAIMKPIGEFFSMIDNRTDKAVEEAASHALILRYVFIFFSLFLLFMLWRTYKALKSTLGGSPDEVFTNIARIGQGDFSAKIQLIDDSQSVMHSLAETKDKLALIDKERKHAEEALKESEFRWKFALEGAGDGVWDVNIQTGKSIYSRLWKEMLGYSEDDIAPEYQEWLTLIHPDDQEIVQKAMQAYAEDKSEVYEVEYRLRCKDDSYKWILSRGMAIGRSTDGVPLRMIGTHKDISERKRTEELLRNSEEKHRILFMESPDAYLIIIDGLFVDCNRATEVMLR
ncbi:MAG: PAS domain-containing protein, partial [Deltaproteobacteria bacterium]